MTQTTPANIEWPCGVGAPGKRYDPECMEGVVGAFR